MYTEKVRIYPNKTQRKLIDKFLWESKNLYNFILDCYIDSLDLKQMYGYSLYPPRFSIGNFIRLYGEKIQLPAQVQNGLRDRLYDAFKRFFEYHEKKKLGIKAPYVGFPKYKSIKKMRSLMFPTVHLGSDGCYNCKIIPNQKKIQFAKLGKIKAVFSRKLIGNPKRCSIKKFPCGHYYAFIVMDPKDQLVIDVPIDRKSVIGIDLGIAKFITTHDGTYVRTPNFLRRKESQIRRAQRELSRKERGSNNYEKSRIKMAKIHEKVRNSRRDHHFKVAHYLVNNYDKICVEDLTASFMINKTRRISKSKWAFSQVILLSIRF